MLLDYDVPSSAVRKLEYLFSDTDDWNIIEQKLVDMNLEELNLLPYERKKLEVALRR